MTRTVTSRVPLLRSLYWRIALACLLLLLAALAVQTALLVVGVARGTGRPARLAAQRLAEVVAGDLGRELERRPRASVPALLARYRALQRPVLFVTPDGQVVGRVRNAPSDAALRRLAQLRPRSGGPDPPLGTALVTVHGAPAGRIVVLPGRPWRAVARDLGPWTLAGAALCAVGGAALLAWLTFGPAHRRLRALETAATRLGNGDLSARAPEDGADEIARVSQAFNKTAGALAAQIQRVTTEQDVRRQLLADVSHELHTPLTTIRGYVETLRMRELGLTDAHRDRYLAIVDDEAVRLERLIGDLLEVARMDAGHALQTSRISVQALWARLTDRHAPTAAAAGVRLLADDSPLHVTADAGRLEQALSNLVGNAIRFTPAGGEVRLSAHDLGAAVRLDVSDTGVGLTCDDQSRVFDRFYKGDTSRSTGGTGLGLSIVRAIAAAHGGSASVRSTPGAGSTFSITIPS